MPRFRSTMRSNDDDCYNDSARGRLVASHLVVTFWMLIVSALSSPCHGFQATSPESSSSLRLSTRPTFPSLHLKALPTSSSSLSDQPSPNNKSRKTALQSTIASSLSWRKTSSSTKETHDWTSQTFQIALPALMGLLADPVLSLVDTGFVGRLGGMDLAALGVCTSIFHMTFTVFRASTVATISLVASASTDAEKRQITKISLQLAGVLGTSVLLGLRLGGPALLATMGVPPTSALYKPACDYLFARCWAAPAVVGIVVAEGAFRGNDDSKTPLFASGIAALFNLILDPIFMFPLGMGMAGAAAATAVSQLGAAGVYAWRIWKRKLLPQPKDPVFSAKSSRSVVKSILGANLSMLAKQGSMLVFYTMATALATRMGPAHVATHQVALSLFWLVTYWLDSGSVAAQVLMGKQLGEPKFARSLTKYMLKYALVQGLALSALVAGVGKLVPGMFSQDATIQSLLMQCLPHLAMQQTLVSFTLVLEGLALGGKQFRYMAAGTAAATAAGVYQLTQATDVVGIWATAVNTFFVGRLLNGIVGVTRVHLGLRRQQRSEQQKQQQQQDSSTVPATL